MEIIHGSRNINNNNTRGDYIKSYINHKRIFFVSININQATNTFYVQVKHYSIKKKNFQRYIFQNYLFPNFFKEYLDFLMWKNLK